MRTRVERSPWFRQHITSSGATKKTYSLYSEALCRATELTERYERAYSAYRCGVCRLFHVGRTREEIRVCGPLFDLWPELGERACGHMRAENYGTEGKREAAIKRRAIGRRNQRTLLLDKAS